VTVTVYTIPPRPALGQGVVRDRTFSAQSDPAAGHEAVAMFPVVDHDRVWYVDRITVSMPGAGTNCQAFLCDDELEATAVIDGTEQGAFDVSASGPPYVITGGRRLIVVWTGPDVLPGLLGNARLDVRVAPAAESSR
jgi:hypothetical protein